MANHRGTDGFSLSSSTSSSSSSSASPMPLRQSGSVADAEKSVDPARDVKEPREDYSTGSDLPRREENPFSFKHFLNKDSKITYNLGGARPKIYSPINPSSEDKVAHSRETDGVYSRNPTELPDFVQDHLVIEQCYLKDEAVDAAAAVVPLVADVENLPDFALNSVEQRGQSLRSSSRSQLPKTQSTTGDLPFDLTGGLDRRKKQDRSASSSSSEKASVYGRPNELLVRKNEPSRSVQDFPFDLPLRTPESRISFAAGPSNSSVSINKTGVNKTLPDFLNDGPIRNTVGSSSEPTSSLETQERSDSSLLSENERLRDQLGTARRHIAERTRMIDSLKVELASRRAVDHEETAHLEKAMEQVEVNLKQSTKRATSAENTVALLKVEVKALTAEISMLRSENRKLASIAGAGVGADSRTSSTERKMKKLSDELRAAATSAEVSLRQLISGVSNLKVLAAAIENVDRIEDRTKDYLPDFEEDNAAGPAL